MKNMISSFIIGTLVMLSWAEAKAQEMGGYVSFSLPSMTVRNGSYGSGSYSDVNIGSRWNDPLVDAYTGSRAGYSWTTFNPSGYTSTYSGSRNGEASVRVEISGSGRAEHFGTRGNGGSEASANSNLNVRTNSSGDASSSANIRIQNGSESYQWKPSRGGKG